MELLFIIILGLYFIPSFCAVGKKGAAGIVALNIFLGWTLVGWVVSLSWALAAPKADTGPGGVDTISGSGNGDGLNIKLRRDEEYAEAWDKVRMGAPIRFSQADNVWTAETEDGVLAVMGNEASRKLSFRADTLGKPRGRVTDLNRGAETYAVIAVEFR